jgi:hypothetical protein
MSTAMMPFQPWCVDYHKTMAATLSLANAAKRGAGILGLAKDFRTVSREFKTLVAELNALTQISPSELKVIIPRLLELHKATNKTLDYAAQHGITGRRLIGAAERAIRFHNENLLDVIERLQLSLDPTINASLKEALKEYERGETVSLHSLV